MIHREHQIETPYLPDPAAAGVALRAMPGHRLPGVTGTETLGPSAEIVSTRCDSLVLKIANGDTWPQSRGFRLVLEEHRGDLEDPPCAESFTNDGKPEWNEEKRILTLFVPKGRIVRLQYSSYVDTAFSPTFGLQDWVDSDGQRAHVRQMAESGCTWMVTPHRSLTLVHATQQPVCEPRFQSLNVSQRQLGDQYADLDARITLHGGSTGHFEIEAEWEEWIDDPQRDGPELVSSLGQLGEVRLAENHVNEFALNTAVRAEMYDPIDRPRAEEIVMNLVIRNVA